MAILLARLALACGLLLCAQLHAQSSSAAVRLDGQVVFRVGNTESDSARHRARRIESQLEAILASPSGAGRARVEASGVAQADRALIVSGRRIVTVTPLDAEASGVAIDDLARQWASAIETALQRAAGRRSSEVDRFVAAVSSSIQNAFARSVDSFIVVVPRALAATIVLLLFWGLAILVRRLLRSVFARVISDLTVENLIKQVGYYAVWCVGLIMAAGTFGIDAEAALTGLGLTSLALGFALKDIISNFVSGLLILLLRPFELGDQIVIGETEGSVERINLRAMQIRTYDGRLVSVPSADAFTSRVTNNTAAPVRRGSVQCFVGYDCDLKKVAAVARQAAESSEGVLPGPLPSVRIKELRPDDVALEVHFWTDSQRSDFVSTSSRVRASLLHAFRENGVGLPDGVVRIEQVRGA